MTLEQLKKGNEIIQQLGELKTKRRILVEADCLYKVNSNARFGFDSPEGKAAKALFLSELDVQIENLEKEFNEL